MVNVNEVDYGKWNDEMDCGLKEMRRNMKNEVDNVTVR